MKRIPLSISFTPENYNFLKKLRKRSMSGYVNESINEKKGREMTKEGMVIKLKQEKKVLAKKMNLLDKQLLDLEED